tara:strand:+ start:823 stop:1452 length:630 start_codon:yes stop_codon:yes gene_type:complete
LNSATPVELDRVCAHLKLAPGSGIDKIVMTYQEAADNSLTNILRPLFRSQALTYTQSLRFILKELRSLSEGLDDTWRAVKSVRFWSYRSAIDDMNDDELESRIYEIYAAEVEDAQRKSLTDSRNLSKGASYVPSLGGVAASTAVTVTSLMATRLPFAAIAPGAIAGPVGMALTVGMLGYQASGPAFRKIIPATIELILIGRRIRYTPEG